MAAVVTLNRWTIHGNCLPTRTILTLLSANERTFYFNILLSVPGVFEVFDGFLEQTFVTGQEPYRVMALGDGRETLISMITSPVLFTSALFTPTFGRTLLAR